MIFILLVHLVAISWSTVHCSDIYRHDSGVLKSYCESQTFHAKCWTDHVIMMQTATYGRMRIGSCVGDDLGHVGCQKDVLSLADRRCSGLQQCEIRIPDGEFDTTKPCHKELKVYLEANYTCLRVISEDQSCSIPATVPPVHLSSTISSRHDCGSASHHWLIQADPGQQITVSLLDFTHRTEDTLSNPSFSPCIPYGHVLEGRDGRNTTICGGGRNRVRFVYESRSNSVEIVLNRRGSNDQQQFLIRIQAVGCSDLRPLKDAWISRAKDEVVVGCNSTSQTWHLTCQGHQWVGVIGNCTQRLLAAQTEARVGFQTSNFSSDILIIIVAAISLTLCILIIFGGVAYVRSWSDRRAILNPVAGAYTSVVATETKCDHVTGSSVQKRLSLAPSLLSFDYTEVLQPCTGRPPYGQEVMAGTTSGPGLHFPTQSSDIQIMGVPVKDVRNEGVMTRFSENV